MFEKVSTAIARACGRPFAFGLAFALVLAWGASGPVFGYSETWQLLANTGTTIITFLMLFILQSSQNRDGAAIQAKLDELIRAVDAADNRLRGVETKTERDLEEIRADHPCE